MVYRQSGRRITYDPLAFETIILGSSGLTNVTVLKEELESLNARQRVVGRSPHYSWELVLISFKRAKQRGDLKGFGTCFRFRDFHRKNFTYSFPEVW